MTIAILTSLAACGGKDSVTAVPAAGSVPFTVESLAAPAPPAAAVAAADVTQACAADLALNDAERRLPFPTAVVPAAIAARGADAEPREDS